jgi:hypothetical protein
MRLDFVGRAGGISTFGMLILNVLPIPTWYGPSIMADSGTEIDFDFGFDFDFDFGFGSASTSGSCGTTYWSRHARMPKCAEISYTYLMISSCVCPYILIFWRLFRRARMFVGVSTMVETLGLGAELRALRVLVL